MNLRNWFRIIPAASLLIVAGRAQTVNAPQAPTPSPQSCEARVNDAVDKLLECIQRSALWDHLSQFQIIADEHPGPDGHGNRDTGTSGYRASVDYVAEQMRKAGYAVRIQTYP